MCDDILVRLRGIFELDLHTEPPDIDTDLIETGLLDSLMLVTLLLGLEYEFGISVDLEAVDLDDIRSLRRITAFVQRLTTADQ